ncbi:MAG: restriction endonuclease subunit S [Bdellovibrionota bacterium]
MTKPNDTKWPLQPISALVEIICGQHILADQYNEDGLGIPYLTGPSDFSNGTILVSKWVTSPKALCAEGDLLLTVKGSGVGKLARADKKYCISRQLMALRPLNIDSKYLFHAIRTVTEDLNRHASGTIPGINKDELDKWKIPCPSIPEQKKIAEILSCWDRAIEQVKKLIAAKKQVKEFLLGVLLSGKKRFKEFCIDLNKLIDNSIPEGWIFKPLGSIFKLTSGKTKPADFIVPGKRRGELVPVYGGNGINGFSNFSLVDSPKIIVGRVGEYCGCVYISDGPTWITDNALYTCEFDDSHDLKYFFYLLSYQNLSRLRSKGGQPLISQGPIHSLSLSVPPLNEQKKIANVLLVCDKEIEYLTDLTISYKREKQALMQQLLTGKIRVKVTS